MRILITGGAGFIGSHVADACLAAGHEVVILDDLSTGRRENIPTAAVFAEGDIREEGFVRDILTGFRPEIVCHQAAQTSVSISAREPLLDADINIMGTLNLLNGCVASDVAHVVFASTGGAIYGEVPEGERASLAWQPRPLSPYACSKFAVENYLVAFAAEHDLRSTVLRYSNVYGPRQDPHGEAGVVAIFSQRALERQPISVFARKSEGDAGCVRDYVYVKDVVRANLAAIDDTIGLPMINVCTGVATSTLDLAKSIVQLAGSETEIVYGPRRVGDVERSVLDPGEPPPLGESIALEDGLRSTLAWFERTSAA
ncbi:MAG: NAD-dependent epimerase/dehydratase family protein [Deltaproteobacteria bacterium]|nr:NAD-dependent epimerase/dehydratase family protein [Deltaproteobacteria bacterium]MBW2724419.1 NAD-dependent epimerase/dehydratase family protein [Deltaproteobacteria bacterium]